MGKSRMTYQNWIVELGRDPLELKENRGYEPPPDMQSLEDPDLQQVSTDTYSEVSHHVQTLLPPQYLDNISTSSKNSQWDPNLSCR